MMDLKEEPARTIVSRPIPRRPGFSNVSSFPESVKNIADQNTVTLIRPKTMRFKPIQAGGLYFAASYQSEKVTQSSATSNLIYKPIAKPLSKTTLSALSSLVRNDKMDRATSDVYSWRKYGQKQVQGSEYPRSYYKCGFTGCPVKKRIERTLDGEIAEIVYRGEHKHSKQDGLLTPVPEMNEGLEAEVDDLSWERRNGSDKEETVEKSTNKQDSEFIGDGFRWRKYGQKVVKGNPYPRSYYRCTNSKCCARKYVERTSEEPSTFMTIYEGRHNHEMPIKALNH